MNLLIITSFWTLNMQSRALGFRLIFSSVAHCLSAIHHNMFVINIVWCIFYAFHNKNKSTRQRKIILWHTFLWQVRIKWCHLYCVNVKMTKYCIGWCRDALNSSVISTQKLFQWFIYKMIEGKRTDAWHRMRKLRNFFNFFFFIKIFGYLFIYPISHASIERII